jgi:hypothetical protein
MMNVVNSGSRYQIYGEDVKTYKRLPIASYEVDFHKMIGFFLTARPDLVANEDKIYGNHEKRVDKVMQSFKMSDRNFGIILSGQKGIGKSLFARILAQRCIEASLPVITVTSYVPGIADFISSIEQEVVVIFDEFEKTFGKQDEYDPQEEMLSLFDGLDNGKKLFVITCNEVKKLNSYLLNRPGRFHYHFNIKNPSGDEVREYMTDKLQSQYHGEIDRIVNFASTINITYDYLRAIAFELNQGYTFEEALGDLNITRTADVRFDLVVIMNDGSMYQSYSQSFDLYEREQRWFRAYGDKSKQLRFNFKPCDIKFTGNQLTLDGSKTNIYVDEDDYWDLSEEQREAAIARAKAQTIREIVFTKCDYDAIERYAV